MTTQELAQQILQELARTHKEHRSYEADWFLLRVVMDDIERLCQEQVGIQPEGTVLDEECPATITPKGNSVGWKIIPEKSSLYTVELEDPEGWRTATVKWDGCVHYYRYFNTPKGLDPANDEEMADYLHICNVDEEIARLQALKRMAYNYFEKQGRGDHYWTPEVVDGSTVGLAQLKQGAVSETLEILADKKQMTALEQGIQEAEAGQGKSWEQVKRDLGWSKD